MASPLPNPEPVPPPADPVAVRACLSPRLAAVFDAEWEFVLDKAKQSKDLAGVHDFVHKWRHFAYTEMKDPGWYFRVQAIAERALVTGQAPEGSISGEEMHAFIDRRLGR